MAEWSNAAVLKTVELRGSGGSNPSLSARNADYEQKEEVQVYLWPLLFVRKMKSLARMLLARLRDC